MSDKFNYYDEMKFGNLQSWVSYINKHYMNLNAPLVKIFKLDKWNTAVDNLYGEVKSARLYLRPFELRAFYLTNSFDQMMGVGSMPYFESEDEMIFTVNFEDMVQTIRDLKNKKVSNIFISYTGTGDPSIIKNGQTLILKINNESIATIDLTEPDSRTTKKLVQKINSFSGFYSYLEGENDSSVNLVNFKETRLKHGKLHIFSPDTVYSGLTDVLEKGDLILTDKWRLYEITSNVPSKDYGWEYSQFTLKCHLRTLDEAILPENYSEQIRKHQYGLAHKVDMEMGRG